MNRLLTIARLALLLTRSRFSSGFFCEHRIF